MLHKAEDHYQSGDLAAALQELAQLPHSPDAVQFAARCELARGDGAAAQKLYEKLSHLKKATVAQRAEAALGHHRFVAAKKFYEQALQQQTAEGELLLLAAIAEYKLGRISAAMQHLEEAARLDYDWQDESPVDRVIQYVLSASEFGDFEQLYLDAGERISGNSEQWQNRWFSIMLPIMDCYTASDPAKQEKRVAVLLQNFSSEFDMQFMHRGPQELERLLTDLARSQVDATFGLEALKNLREGRLAQVSQLVLSLELEHLKQFADLFGLQADRMTSGNFQGFVVLLPRPIALCLMTLYSAGAQEELLKSIAVHPTWLAALIAAGFIHFYHQIELFRALWKPDG